MTLDPLDPTQPGVRRVVLDAVCEHIADRPGPIDNARDGNFGDRIFDTELDGRPGVLLLCEVCSALPVDAPIQIQ